MTTTTIANEPRGMMTAAAGRRGRTQKKRRLTRQERGDAEWIFDGTTRKTGEDRVWVRQRDTKTGVKRYVSTSPSGRSVVRYSLD